LGRPAELRLPRAEAPLPFPERGLRPGPDAGLALFKRLTLFTQITRGARERQCRVTTIGAPLVMIIVRSYRVDSHAGFGSVEHLPQYQRNYRADSLQRHDLVLRFDGHVGSLRKMPV
jgi:hypothetical protein